MLLIVDVNKGFQTQTAECLVIGELTCDALVVVLNKIDLIPPDNRNEKIAKVYTVILLFILITLPVTLFTVFDFYAYIQMKSRVSKTLESTKFKNAPIVAVSAIQGEQSVCERG